MPAPIRTISLFTSPHKVSLIAVGCSINRETGDSAYLISTYIIRAAIIELGPMVNYSKETVNLVALRRHVVPKETLKPLLVLTPAHPPPRPLPYVLGQKQAAPVPCPATSVY